MALTKPKSDQKRKKSSSARSIKQKRHNKQAGHKKDLLIRKGKFRKFVLEILQDCVQDFNSDQDCVQDFKFSPRRPYPVLILQEAAEAHLVGLFEVESKKSSYKDEMLIHTLTNKSHMLAQVLPKGVTSAIKNSEKKKASKNKKKREKKKEKKIIKLLAASSSSAADDDSKNNTAKDNNADKETFISSEMSTGTKSGYVFSNGPKGFGYYINTGDDSNTTTAVKVAKDNNAVNEQQQQKGTPSSHKSKNITDESSKKKKRKKENITGDSSKKKKRKKEKKIVELPVASPPSASDNKAEFC